MILPLHADNLEWQTQRAVCNQLLTSMFHRFEKLNEILALGDGNFLNMYTTVFENAKPLLIHNLVQSKD